jgi:hypothetical protein
VTALRALVSGRAIGSLVVAPIISRTPALGVIEVYPPAVGAFHERAGGLLLTLATAATAVEHARTFTIRLPPSR